MKLGARLPTGGVKEGLDRRLLSALDLDAPGHWECPEHGYLVETSLPAEVYCRCGRAGVRTRSAPEEKPLNQAVPVPA